MGWVNDATNKYGKRANNVTVVVDRHLRLRHAMKHASQLVSAQAAYLGNVFKLTSSYDGSKNHWGTWFLAWLYSERLLCFFGLLHFVATMAVWFHFGYIKFRAVEAIVPNGANLYWWKRLVPPLEFGAMHAILLQMALLPLTMCRYTLTKASENSTLASIIPFKRMTRMHIHLGYCMIGFVAASTVLFFIFFGQGCADQHAGDEPLSASGEKTFCTKMHGEIMLTGYGIFAALFLVGVTSYLRNRIKYEYFYAMHHFVFVMFALAIAHTIDDLNRRGKARSQTFIWFSASLTWYVADRVYMWTQIQQCPVVEWRALGGDHQIARAPATSSDDKKQKKNKKNEPANDATNSEPSDALKKRLAENKVLILRLRRPPDFDFQPGQFAYLHVPSIDRTYHPYSIASAPQENTLDFYVEVAKSKPGAKTKTWTEQLWEIAKGNPKLAVESYVTVQGPYGSATSLGEYRKVLAVGSGTGIVPMISMMKSVYFKLFQRNAQMHQMNQTLATQKAKEIRGSYEVRQKTLWQLVKLLVLGDPALKIGNDVALEKRAPLKESMKNIDDDAKMIIKQAQLVWRSRKIKEAVDTKRANPTSNAVIRTEERMLLSSSSALLYFIPPVIEFTASIFAVSWRILNHSHGIVTDDMQNILLVLTCIGISLHALYWLTHVGIKTPYFLADTVIVGVGIFSAVEWDRLDAFGKFSLYQCLAFLGLSLYRFYRLWSHATLTGPYSHLRGLRQRAMELVGGGDLPDQFELIFVTRSAPFAMHLWDDLERWWSDLETMWKAYASRVSSVRVFVTDKDEEAVKLLQSKVKGTRLEAAGALKATRPDFQQIINDMMMDTVHRSILNGTAGSVVAPTLVTFCGGSLVSSLLNKACLRTMCGAKALKGVKHHSIIFQSENYGITTPSSKIPRSAPKKERTTEKDALQEAQAKEHISSQVERMARSSSYYAPDIYAPSC